MEGQDRCRHLLPQGGAPPEHDPGRQSQQQHTRQDAPVQGRLKVLIVDGAQNIRSRLKQGLDIEIAAPAHSKGMGRQDPQAVQVIEEPAVQAGGFQCNGPEPVQHQSAAEEHGQSPQQDHRRRSHQSREHPAAGHQGMEEPEEPHSCQQEKHPPGAAEENGYHQHSHGGIIPPLPLLLQRQEEQAHQEKDRIGVRILEETVDPPVGVLPTGQPFSEKQAQGNRRHAGAQPGDTVQDHALFGPGIGPGIEEKEQGRHPPQAADEGHARAEGHRGRQKGAQHDAAQQIQRRSPG